MTNRHKNKGDRNERAAVVALVELAGDLALANPGRLLGAGRRDDIGDLRVFGDVAIQVRALADLPAALRSAAVDASIQASRSGLPMALGLVPIPRARSGPDAVRWLASCEAWPLPLGDVPTWGSTSKLVEWLRVRPTTARPDVLSVDERVGRVERKGVGDLYVATLQTWVRAYRTAVTGEARHTAGPSRDRAPDPGASSDPDASEAA